MEQARLDDDIAARKQVFDANRKAATREKDRARAQLVMADGKARRTIEKAIWQCQPRVARLLRELQGISLSEGAEAETREEVMMMTSEHFEARGMLLRKNKTQNTYYSVQCVCTARQGAKVHETTKMWCSEMHFNYHRRKQKCVPL